MRYTDKRSRELAAAHVQDGNRSWWTAHTMSYDWKRASPLPKFSRGWYDDIDHRFLAAASLIDGGSNPFDSLMGADGLRGRRVLEIGCGMGLHAEMLVRAGAEVTTVDLSATSTMATRRRLELKDLQANVLQMDAEHLGFPDSSFDTVWSWGVIHHSAHTGRIVREVERVLRPGGEARIMVYNLEGAPAYVTLLRQYLLGFWRGRSLDELLWRSTDGFSARFYTRDALSDLLLTFFESVDVSVLGQAADVVPLPAAFRRLALRMLPIERQRALARKRGAYLFAVARKDAG